MKDTCRCLPINRHELPKSAWNWACNSAERWVQDSCQEWSRMVWVLVPTADERCKRLTFLICAQLTVRQVPALQFNGGDAKDCSTLGKWQGLKTSNCEFCLIPASWTGGSAFQAQTHDPTRTSPRSAIPVHTAKAPLAPKQGGACRSDPIWVLLSPSTGWHPVHSFFLFSFLPLSLCCQLGTFLFRYWQILW